MVLPRIRKRDESLLFLKRLVKNPKSMGALFPSSSMLADFICSHVPVDNDHYIVELGAGTGRFTKALLKSGITNKNLIVVELDPDMAAFLRHNFPELNVIEGNANQLPYLLPPQWLGKVGTIISGIPMVNLTIHEQKSIITSCMQVLSEQGSMLQFTYGPVSPLPAKKMGLRKKRLGYVLMNFPPAVVWRYWPEEIPLNSSKIKNFSLPLTFRNIKQRISLKRKNKIIGLNND